MDRERTENNLEGKEGWNCTYNAYLDGHRSMRSMKSIVPSGPRPFRSRPTPCQCGTCDRCIRDFNYLWLALAVWCTFWTFFVMLLLLIILEVFEENNERQDRRNGKNKRCTCCNNFDNVICLLWKSIFHVRAHTTSSCIIKASNIKLGCQIGHVNRWKILWEMVCNKQFMKFYKLQNGDIVVQTCADMI